jgi:hypothetical protein
VRSQAKARREVGIVPTVLIGNVFLAGTECAASVVPCFWHASAAILHCRPSLASIISPNGLKCRYYCARQQLWVLRCAAGAARRQWQP